jgi:hypothetical protein
MQSLPAGRARGALRRANSGLFEAFARQRAQRPLDRQPRVLQRTGVKPG